jgi:hypothetical protein
MLTTVQSDLGLLKLSPSIFIANNDNFAIVAPMTSTNSFDNGDVAADPLAELPSPDTKRWVVRRKAVVVQAVRSGMITLQEACQRYNLSLEEFVAWERAIERYGVPGLRVTRLQIYRDTDEDARRSSAD